MALGGKVKDIIARNVSEILRQWGGNAPIDLHAIAEQYDAKVMFTSDMPKSVSSSTIRFADNFSLIIVNKNQSILNARLAIARELAFVILSYFSRSSLNVTFAERRHDTIADEITLNFAAELLIPTELFSMLTSSDDIILAKKYSDFLEVPEELVYYKSKILNTSSRVVLSGDFNPATFEVISMPDHAS